MLNRIASFYKRTFRLHYTLKCLRALLFDGVDKRTVSPNTLLIVRLDVIGDYVLFRNFLEILRNSNRFNAYRITLCGNELWKDLANEFDNSFVDEFLWINKNLFLNDAVYRKNILHQIASKGFEVAICPNAARDFLLGDALIRASHAPVRIGAAPNKSIDNWLFSRIGSLYYTRLIDNRRPPSEFDKSKMFFEQLLGEHIDIDLPHFNLPQHSREKTIIIIPGAGEPARQWKIDHFITVINALLSDSDYKVIIAGGPADTKLADSIMKQVQDRVEDLTGKTSLSGLVHLIAKAALVIAHDSGGLHIAAATRTSVIGLMTGKHYMRFGPYTHAPLNMKLLFPETEEYFQKLFKKYGPSYLEDVMWDINQITPEAVIEQSKKLLYEIPAHR